MTRWMLEKTDYGGCPLCEYGWESWSWYGNCARLVVHVLRNHDRDELREFAEAHD